jgi:hypothetical protein
MTKLLLWSFNLILSNDLVFCFFSSWYFSYFSIFGYGLKLQIYNFLYDNYTLNHKYMSCSAQKTIIDLKHKKLYENMVEGQKWCKKI